MYVRRRMNVQWHDDGDGNVNKDGGVAVMMIALVILLKVVLYA